MKSVRFAWFIRWSMAIFTALLLASCGGDDDVSNNADRDVIAANQRLPANAFASTLSGVEEVPVTPSTAIGTGIVLLDPATRILRATINTAGITAIAAHIHEAPAGIAGPIIFPMAETFSGSGIWTTQVTLTDLQIATLRAGNYYFNVHSPVFPAGEIRGQILRQLPRTGLTGITGTGTAALGTGTASTTTFFNVLNGAQQVPPTVSAAIGIGIVIVDPTLNTLSVSVTTIGSGGSAAHIHQAAIGVVGPVIFSLTETFPGIGIWISKTSITATQITALTNGDYYLDVHSPFFPDGEIRGQLIVNRGVLRTAATGTGLTGTDTAGTRVTGSTPTGTGMTGTGVPGMAITGSSATATPEAAALAAQ